MAHIEIISTQFAKIIVESSKPSNPIQKTTQAVAAQLTTLTLGSSKPSKPKRKACFALDAEIDSLINKFITSISVTNRFACCQTPRKIAGIKRRLEQPTIEAQESAHKRRRTEQDPATLIAFEDAQKTTLEVYETRLDYPSPYSYASCPVVKSVTKTILEQQQVKHLSSRAQIEAYSHLLKTASLPSLPYYLALFGRSMQLTRSAIAREIAVHDRREREIKKTGIELRVYNSLKQKAKRDGDAKKSGFRRKARYCRRRARDEQRGLERVGKEIRGLRVVERGYLALIEQCERRLGWKPDLEKLYDDLQNLDGVGKEEEDMGF
ncbi:MAG: hypothetical protein Q9191_005541 [Dirinaria sp. TL-2023a]